MSYIRYGSVYWYVDGESGDYIFPSRTEKGEALYIEDYGHISNETITELIAKYLDADFPEFKTYIIQHLAEKLGVKLRDTPLTSRQAFDLQIKSYGVITPKKMKSKRAKKK